jgi:ornithine lipid ester-linked acyl 2-hydroxylase
MDFVILMKPQLDKLLKLFVLDLEKIMSFYRTLQECYSQFALDNLARNYEIFIEKQTLVGNDTFFDTENFRWITDLENNWVIIRSELDDILENVDHLPNFQDISADQYEITQDDLWKVLFLYAYGYKAHRSCSRCPQTTRLIEQIPGMKTAFFSILYPHKHIPEHRGLYKGVLRYHLALKVPIEKELCGIRVGSDIRSWEEGKSLVFDDTFPHEAWNNTDEIRVILFLDFVRPLRFPFSLLNQVMIQFIGWSSYVQQGRKNFLDWENQGLC